MLWSIDNNANKVRFRAYSKWTDDIKPFEYILEKRRFRDGHMARGARSYWAYCGTPELMKERTWNTLEAAIKACEKVENG